MQLFFRQLLGRVVLNAYKPRGGIASHLQFKDSTMNGVNHLKIKASEAVHTRAKGACR